MTESFRAIRPKPDEHLDYYSKYIERVPDGDIVDTLSRQITETLAFLHSIPESRVDYQYAPGKWTIRQVVGHLSDGERVFSIALLDFRALIRRLSPALKKIFTWQTLRSRR